MNQQTRVDGTKSLQIRKGILISDQRMGKDNDLYELNSFGVCEVIKMYVSIDQMQSNKKKLLRKVIS